MEKSKILMLIKNGGQQAGQVKSRMKTGSSHQKTIFVLFTFSLLILLPVPIISDLNAAGYYPAYPLNRLSAAKDDRGGDNLLLMNCAMLNKRTIYERP